MPLLLLHHSCYNKTFYYCYYYYYYYYYTSVLDNRITTPLAQTCPEQTREGVGDEDVVEG